MSGKLLLVEDEDSLAVGLRDVLEVKGYAVERVSTAEDARERMKQGAYDLLILDVELPGMSGFDFLRLLRKEGSDVRVLMLTARKTELDKVLGFELGVDDYLGKPFSLGELLGRVKALLRRAVQRGGDAPSALRLGAAEVDLEAFKVTREGQELKLPTRAFALLQALLRRSGQVMARDQLIDEVWGRDEYISQRTLNNLIVKLRQAVEENPEDPSLLKTVHGVGYRLDLP